MYSGAGRVPPTSDPCTFERARPIEKPIDPLTEDDVVKLLAAYDQRSAIKRKGQREYDFERRSRKRDGAVIFALLDTGACASEICEVIPKDLDIDSGRVKVTGRGARCALST